MFGLIKELGKAFLILCLGFSGAFCLGMFIRWLRWDFIPTQKAKRENKKRGNKK